jgi:hypothetical protein
MIVSNKCGFDIPSFDKGREQSRVHRCGAYYSCFSPTTIEGFVNTALYSGIGMWKKASAGVTGGDIRVLAKNSADCKGSTTNS